MPTYEFRCRTCGTRFEVRRPMAEADAPAPCPDGHDATVRLLSVFASVGGARPGAGDLASAGGGGGGCCGGACGCGH